MQTQSALHSLLTSEKFLQAPEVNKLKKVLKTPVDLGGIMFDLMTSEKFPFLPISKQAEIIACILKATHEEEYLTVRDFCQQNGIPACCHLPLSMKVYGYCKRNKIQLKTIGCARSYPVSAFNTVLSEF